MVQEARCIDREDPFEDVVDETVTCLESFFPLLFETFWGRRFLCSMSVPWAMVPYRKLSLVCPFDSVADNGIA